jgi:hypothetical protein
MLLGTFAGVCEPLGDFGLVEWWLLCPRVDAGADPPFDWLC